MATQVLIPLDGSGLAEQALSCAMMLARGLEAELVLFRAVMLPSEATDFLVDADVEAAHAPLVTQANEYLSQVAKQLRESGATVGTVVRCGPPAEAILDYVMQADIQHIVMATHGYSGISRWMHGSVAERVLQAASVPVLLIRVREPAAVVAHRPLSCQRILVPLDGSSVAEQVLQPATAIATALGAEVVLFRVLVLFSSVSLTGEWHIPLENVVEIARQDAGSYLERVASTVKAQGVRVSSAIQIGAVANAIIEFAESNQIDLIAMCTHGRTGLARWALGSVADRVLRAGRNPLFLVRAR